MHIRESAEAAAQGSASKGHGTIVADTIRHPRQQIGDKRSLRKANGKPKEKDYGRCAAKTTG